MRLPPLAERLLDGANPSTLTTLDPDGSPHSTPVWTLREGSDVLISTIAARRKARNIERDPRVSVVVVDSGDPLAYVAISGSATIEVDEGRDLRDRLARRYLGTAYPRKEPHEIIRVAVRIKPERVFTS